MGFGRMGFRDRLGDQATRIGESARKAAASAPVQRAGESARKAAASAPVGRVEESFRGFRTLLADDGQILSIEAYLLTLVRAVRNDERDEEQSKRDVYVGARKRRRRLGLASFAAGPWAGAASRVADLYCEAATVCDVANLHDQDLSDEQIAAHMLVLWSIMDDFEAAEKAMRGEPTVAKILGAKLLEFSGITLSEKLTKLTAAKALWEFHQVDIRGMVTGAKKAAGGQPIRSVAFTGHRTKKVIKKAEGQLGVKGSGSPN